MVASHALVVPRLGSTVPNTSNIAASGGTVWFFETETDLTASTPTKSFPSSLTEYALPVGWSS